MTLRLTLLATLALALGPVSAFSQASAPLAMPELPASGASAPAATAPTGPRLRSPAETGNRAAAPGELRPERPVTPQISIPFGKKQTPPDKREEPRAIKRGKPEPTGDVDEAAARCDSQVDPGVRASCRAKLAREASGRVPN